MHVVWAILRQNRLGGVTSRGEPEKSQNDMSPLTQGLRYRAACDSKLHLLFARASYALQSRA